MFWHFQAVYFTCAPIFMVYAPTEAEARSKARSVASRALCIILRCVEGNPS